MKPIRDREARDRAAFSEENVAVTAGAGTGKTTLLVDAVLGRLLVRGVPLRRVLMLTFTEKAAAEMRIRLEARLRALIDPVSEGDVRDRKNWDERAGISLEERAQAALAEIDRAEISTIHGFCAHFLREFPIEAGLVPSFAVDEGPKFEERFDREWGRWLDAELKADSPRRAEWLRVLAKATLDDLREVAAGLSSFHVPDWALDPERALETGRNKLLHAVTDVSGRLGSLAARHPGENNLKKQLIQVASFLLSPTPDAASELPRKASQAEKGWPGGTFKAAQDLMAEALPLAADLARLDPELLADALGLVSTFARGFRASFVREGWIGFDGLLTKTRDLLASADFREVRDQAKRKYDFVVVDEFQDTDPVQCEIVLFLAEDPGSGAADAMSVRLARGKLFIVGDPKQSIYSFRGADIVAYERLKDRILAQGGSRERLETSFRSHSGILGTVNALFRTIITKRGEVQPEYEEIFAVEGRDPILPSQKVEALLFQGSDGRLSSERAREAEGGAIAEWIADNVGKLEVPDREPGSKRKLRLKDVAILLRALTDVHLLLDRFRARGIRFVVEGEKYYYGTQEVIDFVNLLRAVADPHDTVALAGLLRSPLGAVDDDALLELAKAKKLDYRKSGPAGAIGDLFALLRDLHERHGRMTVPELIDEIFERTEALELAGLSWHGEQAVANLLKMRRAAEAFEESGVEAPTLRGFLRRVSRDIREMAEEGESPLADEGLDAVRVMSIHKAKGLEFPVVFLPDLHRSSTRRDDPPVRYDWPERVLGIRRGPLVDAGGAFLAHTWRRRAEEESKRVLYVAMTRARERLVLTGGADFRGACFLSELVAAIERAGGPSPDRAKGRITAGGLDLEVRHVEWKEPRRKKSKAAAASRKKAPSWSALDKAWKARERERVERSRTSRFTSPTALQESPAELVQVAVDEGERRRAAETGTLCHLVLERLDFWKPDVDRLVKVGARELGVADPTEARSILKSFLDTEAFKTLAGAEIVARELPFLLPHDGGVMQGVIDLVARIDGKLAVIDYKSDRVEQPEKYAGQRKWYVEAAKRILGEKDPEFKLLYLRTGRFT